jgi:polysaccharide pyruvyl transferase WcaK-like protein
LAELTRAANNLAKRNNHQRKRLVEEAITSIERLRDRVGVTATLSASDPAFELQFISAAITIGWATDSRVKMALLAAAGAIRELSAALDSESEVNVSQGQHR